MSTRENTGLALGLLGVIIFSLTLPMTRIVVQEMHPLLRPGPGPGGRDPGSGAVAVAP